MLVGIFVGNALLDPIARKGSVVSSLLYDNVGMDIAAYLTGRARTDKEVKFADRPPEGKKLLFEAMAKKFG